MVVVALDPGRNIGLAVVADDGRLLEARIVEESELGSLVIPDGAKVVVGDGTGSDRVVALLEERGVATTPVDETGTSLEARSLYFRDHPPKLPWRVLPRGMWPPPPIIDHYAAYAIALRYLKTQRGG